MRTRRWTPWTATLVLALLGAASCSPASRGSSSALGDNAVTVASFNFPESVVLAELYAQALEGRGIRVERQFELGTRELIHPALQLGLVELVPEYSGSLLDFMQGEGSASSESDLTRDTLVSALAPRGLVALEAAEAQDHNAFAVTRATAKELGLVAISDLAGHGERLTLGGPPECPSRDLCLLGLERVYGLRFEGFVELDAGGPITIEALRRGFVDVALVFSTTPGLAEQGIVLLHDDRELQPAENVTPVVHGATMDRFGPELREALDAVSSRLTTDALRRLNQLVTSGEATPAEAATAWLLDQGLAVPPR